MRDGVLIFLLAFGVSLAVCALMAWIGPRDAPDGGRKTQVRAVPSGGGLGIATGHLTALSASMLAAERLLADGHWLTGTSGQLLIVLTLISLSVLLLGFVDDVRPLPSKAKLVILMGICSLAAVLGWLLLAAAFDWVPSLGIGAVPLLLGGVLWLFVVTNATNFMDGSNGLALGSTAIMLGGLGVLFAPVAGLVPAILAFLVFNLMGRLYAGDAGALYVGFWVASLSLMGAFIGHYSIWIPPLLLLPFLTDIILTIIWRARRGGNVMQAHREHAYQLFRRAGWGHLQVAVLWWAMTLVCTILAVWSARQETVVQLASFAAALTVSIALWIWQRRAYWPRVSEPVSAPG